MSDVDHVEEHVGGIRPVGQISYFVHDENVRVRVGSQRLTQVSFLTRVRKVFDQFGCEVNSASKPFWMARYPMATAKCVFPRPVFPCRIKERPSVTKSGPK